MNVFELFAKIGLNTSEYDKGLEDAESKGKKASSAIIGALGGIGKGALIALGAGVTGVTALTTASVKAYSDFEQLMGGTKLLYGEAFDWVMDKSKEAYTNVQMSQNDYLQQVNGFATGLKVALGDNEQAAAELANEIVKAEADIVSATGVSRESVENAFNGIMKSNFTMIDNLQLGIAPTKEGFQQMIDSVNEYNEAHGNMTNYTIDNLADCQSALIDYINMQGLSGYAQNEATETIQGSLAMLKGSWTDFVAGLSNPDADIGLLISNMVNSADIALHNLAPAVETAIESIATVLPQIAPIVNQYLPQLASTVLPQLIKTAIILVNGLVDALPSIISAIIPILPEVLQTVIDAIIEILPMLIEVAIQIVEVVGQGLLNNLDLLIDSAIQLVVKIAETITEPNNIEMLLNSALRIIKALNDGLIRNAPLILSAIATVMGNVLTGIGNALPNIADFLLGGVSDIFTLMFEDIGTVLNTIGDIFSDVFGGIKKVVSDVIGFIVGLFSGDATKAFNSLGDVVWDVLDTITSVFDDIFGGATDLVNNLIGAFKFKWELPKIKLPHISVSGGVAPYGIGGAGSLPKFDIKWYAQGYQDAMLLDKATIFGMDKNGRMLGGGEGNGTEAVVGTDLLMNMIQSVVRGELSSLQLPVYLDGDKMVGYLAPRIDNELGRLSNLSAKGAY